ncbi:MAG: PIN domain-containing protein [Betaproteobacteria bacterium]|nr:PIN domain-containing protein [Betaproteobacteria bacterium]
MPGAAIVDTGPLAAWFRGNDPYHGVADRFFRGFDGELLATWPVVVEVTHLLRTEAQLPFLAWVRKGGLALGDMDAEDLEQIERLIAKYRDQPMDFADATLVLLAERTGVGDIITLDRKQFEVYRFRGNRRFTNLMPSSRRRPGM